MTVTRTKSLSRRADRVADRVHDEATEGGAVWRVSALKEVSYDVMVQPRLLDPANPALARAVTSGAAPVRRLIVIDATVASLYGEQLTAYLAGHDVEFRLCVIDAHESVKVMATVFEVVDAMDAFGVPRRHAPVVAMGGGVLTDIVGLAASLYRRATPYIRIPTTLIGMIDAGIGSKTGVNFREHKNRLGAYHPSSLTLIDPGFLSTLDSRHLRNGLAEILKIALIKDAELFDLLATHGAGLVEQRMQPGEDAVGGTALTVLRRAVQGMLEELQPNLWEDQLQRLVDFGHSFSPTIEMTALPELLHGEAVCVDMALSSVLAHHRGLLTTAELDRVLDVMRVLHLPVLHPVCTPELLRGALADTVKHRDGRQHLPLPQGIGDAVFVDDVTQHEVEAALFALGERERATRQPKVRGPVDMGV
ncbi:sedoheptulose 7-phosphate cyclase [Streptomyces hygroscopicus]|uniref:sedoheptulose 7-phosphate cyclase n=1 Tax=Streptomyces hygroscopicus TaxID=1912 RepID=UPI0033EF106B